MHRRLYITHSRIFEKQGKTGVGQKLLISAVSDLNTGDTIAIFNRFGNTSLSSDESNKYLRGPQSSPKQCLVTWNFISSELGLLFVFREKKASFNLFYW